MKKIKLLTVLQEFGTNFSKVFSSPAKLNTLNKEYFKKNKYYKNYEAALRESNVALRNLQSYLKNSISREEKKKVLPQLLEVQKVLKLYKDKTNNAVVSDGDKYSPNVTSSFLPDFLSNSNIENKLNSLKFGEEYLQVLETFWDKLFDYQKRTSSLLYETEKYKLSQKDYESLSSGESFFYEISNTGSTIFYYFFHEGKAFVLQLTSDEEFEGKAMSSIIFRVQNKKEDFSTYESYVQNYKESFRYSLKDTTHSDSVGFWKKLFKFLSHYSNKYNVKVFQYSGADDESTTERANKKSEQLRVDASQLHSDFTYELLSYGSNTSTSKLLTSIIKLKQDNVAKLKIDLNTENFLKLEYLLSHSEDAFKELLTAVPKEQQSFFSRLQKAYKNFQKYNNESLLSTYKEVVTNLNSTTLKQYLNSRTELSNVLLSLEEFYDLVESSFGLGEELLEKLDDLGLQKKYKDIKGRLNNTYNYTYAAVVIVCEKLISLLENETNQKANVQLLLKEATKEVYSSVELKSNNISDANEALKKALTSKIKETSYERNELLTLLQEALDKVITSYVSSNSSRYSLKDNYKTNINYVVSSLPSSVTTVTGVTDHFTKSTFSPLPNSYDVSALKKFKTYPGSLYELTKFGKYALFNRREKLYYKALTSYGVPQENVTLTRTGLVFKLP